MITGPLVPVDRDLLLDALRLIDHKPLLLFTPAEVQDGLTFALLLSFGVIDRLPGGDFTTVKDTDTDLLYPLAPSLTIERRQIVMQAELEGDPVPWARAGSGKRGQRYTPKRYAEHLEALAWAMREGYKGKAPLAVELGVWCTFVRRTHRRVDLDNMLKACMDAGTGLVWADDSQIRVALVRVLFDPDLPRTELVAYRLELPTTTIDAGPAV